MKTMKTLSARSKGSALLIVLGFLSFMTISAVSFAIFMRIERQASSNYRHTLEARHMLNSALFRAIEEIDSDLRDTVNNDGRKFPTNWTSRVRVSAVEDKEDNDQDARVLSLEALSFVPGILVNDVRRYAVRNSDDEAWMGAKWRKLSMPVPTLGDSSGNALSADGQAVIGRYAYACINVSDMLNVNDCTNRIELSQLFGRDASAISKYDDFVTKFVQTDRRYETLQDFYACMQQRRGSERDDPEMTGNVKKDTPFGSPFHTWIGGANDDADAGFMYAGNQVLVTEGLAKPELVDPLAYNIRLKPVVLDPDPYAEGDLDKMFEKTTVTGGATVKFSDALLKVFDKNDSLPIDKGTSRRFGVPMVGTLLADYLDEDSIPRRLDKPTVEQTPMISQIVINNLPGGPGNPLSLQPIISVETTTDAATGKEIKSTYLQLVGNATTVSLSVEVVWPFRHFENQSLHSYKLNVVMCFRIIQPDRVLRTKEDWASSQITLKDPRETEITPFSEGAIKGNVNKCYQKISPEFDAGAAANKILLLRDGVPQGDYTADDISVACAMMVQVIQTDRDAKTGKSNIIVDQVPYLQAGTVNRDADQTDNWESSTPKLYFQTKSQKLTGLATGSYPLEYKRNSLEIADPRFNYRAANWVASSTADKEVDASMNKLSTTEVLGKDGRDADIFMSVGNTGVLQSPGEMGFVVRPFPYDDGEPDDVDLMSQTDITKVPDYNAFFRTIRLYDHVDPKDTVVTKDAAYFMNRAHDPLYEFFYGKSLAGTVAGCRVNPLSNIPVVLESAINNTPFDYYTAFQSKNQQRNYRFNTKEWGFNWPKLMDAWAGSFVSNGVQTRLNMSISYTNRLASLYGDQDAFKWYSPDDSTKIFKTDLNSALYEVERKMLFSYSLDNFCDRQQLFLYILRAEKTGPQLGNDAELGVRSLAGGRAVALVWRDPYPSENKYCKTDDDYNSDRMAYWSGYPDGDGSSRVAPTPWSQYYKDVGKTSVSRRHDLHEHRILFFKQLDN